MGIDEDTGEELWRRPVSEGADGAGSSVWSSAAIDEDRGLAYIGTGPGHGRDGVGQGAHPGQPAGRCHGHGRAAGTGAIFVASNEMDPTQLATSNRTSHHSSVFALDAATGHIIWQQREVGATFGSITYADGVVDPPSLPGVLQALDAETGVELWSTEPGGDMGAGVRVVDGWVLVPHGFWFFGGQSDLPGGVVAYTLPD